MRALRVLGIAEDGGHLVCAETGGTDGVGETFGLPLDDRLRAAVRGDLSRFGQLEIEMEPQLRPREIQRRIRAGASIEQVAAAAGCSPDRIERYAYPVLMERGTVAERARLVRPLQGAAIGSAAAARASRTLTEIVTATLADRGQHQEPLWDAYRDERGWTVTATWKAGRSENRAEWAYTAGPDGGSVTARNEIAADLVEPAPRPLRTIGDEGRDERHDARPRRMEPTALQRLAEDVVADDRSGALPIPQPPTRARLDVPQRDSAMRTGTDGPTAVVPAPITPVTTARDGAPSAGSSLPEPAHGHSARDAGVRDSKPTARSSQRGHRPPMPSWEDVLLGTRTPGH